MKRIRDIFTLKKEKIVLLKVMRIQGLEMPRDAYKRTAHKNTCTLFDHSKRNLEIFCMDIKRLLNHIFL